MSVSLNRPVEAPKQTDSQDILNKFENVLLRLKDVSDRVSTLRARSVGVSPVNSAATPKQVWDSSLSGSLNHLISDSIESLDNIQSDLEAVERFI